MAKRIAFTGGSGKAGRHVLPWLVNKGYQVFNAANDTVSSNIPSRELADKYYPNVPFTRVLGEFEALFSKPRIRDVLGFKEERNWRLYVD